MNFRTRPTEGDVRSLSRIFRRSSALFWAGCLFFVSAALFADQSDAKTISLLGLQLYQAYSQFGVPTEVYSIRGDAAWQDDVVFYYSSHIYLYWYEDRVWQVRFDRYFEDAFLGLTMGASEATVKKTLGDPIASQDNWMVFQLPDQGFPVRARLFFKDGALDDAYIYRSDF